MASLLHALGGPDLVAEDGDEEEVATTASRWATRSVSFFILYPEKNITQTLCKFALYIRLALPYKVALAL